MEAHQYNGNPLGELIWVMVIIIVVMATIYLNTPA